jgi:ATP-dependent helicase/nuclease subunit B
MTIARHFLGWDAPVVEKVRDYLVPAPPAGPVDLRGTLVVVPTRQSQRRLREALTLYCARHGTYLLAPTLRTPPHLLMPGDESLLASPLDIMAGWTEVLRTIDVSQFHGLFPMGAPERGFAWALSTGMMVQSLRDELAEHGIAIESLVAKHGEALQEQERWRDLARLEQLFVSMVETRFGLQDPCRAAVRRAAEPVLPPPIERIVVACSPDPTPVALAALEVLSTRVQIDVLVHAPPGMADGFDRWGRPSASWWHEQMVDIAPADLRLASSPAAQGRLAVETLVETGRNACDVALGVPDETVVPYLETALAQYGVTSYDPSGALVSRHPVFRLLQGYRDLSTQRSYAALSVMLRNADVLEHLRRAHGIGAKALLTELDAFQNEHLPVSMQDVADRLQEDEAAHQAYPTLHAALRQVKSLTSSETSAPAEQRLRDFLQAVYATKELRPGAPEDEEFRTVAEKVDEALRDLAGGIAPLLHLTPHETIDLLLRHLAEARYPLEKPPDTVDLQGWLELAWDDAPLVVVTGMNDNAVPGKAGNEAFLPESLRSTLGLRSEADRLARDIYLTRTLIESRRHTGRVCCVTGKYGQDGEPLRPSRVLFRCGDAGLPQRARRLFGPPDDVRPSVPASVSFRLRPSAPLERDATIAIADTLAVTAFRDYLNCPFRFYLKRILRMESLADTKAEMDALDFGGLVHDALARLAADAEMRGCSNAAQLRRHLDASVDRWADRHFGPHPPLHLTMQLDVARDRLSAAAEAQAREASQGWEIMMSEEALTLSCGDMTVKGRVDRVDRHRDTGAIRVLDYKTSDNAKPPHELHFGAMRESCRDYSRIIAGNRERRWVDLQLPFYVWMLRSRFGSEATIRAGYFNLPRESDAAGVNLWDELTEEVLASAAECATGVVEDIRARRFWPPAAKVDFDDFESLFPAGATAGVDGEGFAAFLEGWHS